MKLRALAVAAVAVVAALVYWLSGQSGYHLTRAVVTLPAGVTFASSPAQFSLSPDGQQLAVNLRGPNGVRVWTWRLDGIDARPLTGTEGVTSPPVWSPDSANVAFASEGRLRRMPVTGGSVETICPLGPDASFDWGSDETILFANGAADPIRRVSAARAAAGAVVQQLTRLNPGEQHELPRFVPGSRWFLFFVRADSSRDGVWAGSLDGGTGLRLVPEAVTASVAGDYLVYSVDQAVVGQRFDRVTLGFSGSPATLADGVRGDASKRLAYSVSGMPPVLVFQSEADGALHVTRDWPALMNGH